MPVAAVVPVAAGMLPTCWQLLVRRRYAVGVMIAAGRRVSVQGVARLEFCDKVRNQQLNIP